MRSGVAIKCGAVFFATGADGPAGACEVDVPVSTKTDWVDAISTVQTSS